MPRWVHPWIVNNRVKGYWVLINGHRSPLVLWEGFDEKLAKGENIRSQIHLDSRLRKFERRAIITRSSVVDGWILVVIRS